MKLLHFWIVVLTFQLSCKNDHYKNDSSSILLDSINSNFSIEEQLIDSSNIGVKGEFKIDVKQIRYHEGGVFIEFRFYKKVAENWIMLQSYKLEKDGITSLDLMISDYNNDGFNDITVQSNAAARGSNEIKSLFIFNKNKEELKLIKNSTKYPNLAYNKELNCIDAWMVYGGSTTVFLNLDSDTLREFAGIELFDNVRIIYEVDKEGHKTIIEEKQIQDLDPYIRFKNYKPLETNKNEREH